MNFDKLLRMISDNIRTQRFDVSMTSFSSDKKFKLSGLIYTWEVWYGIYISQWVCLNKKFKHLWLLIYSWISNFSLRKAILTFFSDRPRFFDPKFGRKISLCSFKGVTRVNNSATAIYLYHRQAHLISQDTRMVGTASDWLTRRTCCRFIRQVDCVQHKNDDDQQWHNLSDIYFVQIES